MHSSTLLEWKSNLRHWVALDMFEKDFGKQLKLGGTSACDVLELQNSMPGFTLSTTLSYLSTPKWLLSKHHNRKCSESCNKSTKMTRYCVSFVRLL